ncbi:triphosphoribosyl-dephospho-CoA synthase [Methanorbis furvi]|uniref:2-(5''-triphosphoribosyl)-3'-dephosphocoenzyme-A synthase n=1 Tax=Methanorbis furvi TaxID=3028299 RepID=A0AAE4MDN5_9EURY|nr:2-(5''-triphosphoribosyl)-3'-dephosphocoenzyme-A synthase [Methanocorpusculaceae archaeon Ag1]
MSQQTVEPVNLAELAQFAMLLEVTAKQKPGNIDRCHDYDDTHLAHFLASAVLAGPVFSRVAEGSISLGEAMYDAVARTNIHNGGNTHFGAFILLLPLIAGRGTAGAAEVVKKTTIEDAVLFYKAFGLTQVRVRSEDPMDVNDPSSIQRLIDEKITMYQVMEYSALHDMVAREWTNGFLLTRRAANLLFELGDGEKNITKMFLSLMAECPDTFIAKKFDQATAEAVMQKAAAVLAGNETLAEFDEECIRDGINPGSLADICIAGIFTALLEGWKWDC